jgi:hypothetical protein
MPCPVCPSFDFCPCDRCENDAIGKFWYLNEFEYGAKVLIDFCETCAEQYKDSIVEERAKEKSLSYGREKNMSGCLILDSDEERSVEVIDYTGIVFFVVPFADKDKAKKLGALWSMEEKKWYIQRCHISKMIRAGFRPFVKHIFKGEEEEIFYDPINVVRLNNKWDLCDNRECRLCMLKHENHKDFCRCDWCSCPE